MKGEQNDNYRSNLLDENLATLKFEKLFQVSNQLARLDFSGDIYLLLFYNTFQTVSLIIVF